LVLGFLSAGATNRSHAMPMPISRNASGIISSAGIGCFSKGRCAISQQLQNYTQSPKNNRGTLVSTECPNRYRGSVKRVTSLAAMAFIVTVDSRSRPVIRSADDPPRDRAKDGRFGAGILRHSRPGNHRRDLRIAPRVSEDRASGKLNQPSHFGATRQTTRTVRKREPRNAARPKGKRT
jgi:hypothetical protein